MSCSNLSLRQLFFPNKLYTFIVLRTNTFSSWLCPLAFYEYMVLGMYKYHIWYNDFSMIEMRRILSNDLPFKRMSKEILYKLSNVTFHRSVFMKITWNGCRLKCKSLNGLFNWMGIKTHSIVTSKATFCLFNDLLIFYNNVWVMSVMPEVSDLSQQNRYMQWLRFV